MEVHPDLVVMFLVQSNLIQSKVTHTSGRWPTSTLITFQTSCCKRAGWPIQVASDQRPEVCFGHTTLNIQLW